MPVMFNTREKFYFVEEVEAPSASSSNYLYACKTVSILTIDFIYCTCVCIGGSGVTGNGRRKFCPPYG